MEEFPKLAADMSKNQVLNEIKAHPEKPGLYGGFILMITAGETNGSEPVKIEKGRRPGYIIIILSLF